MLAVQAYARARSSAEIEIRIVAHAFCVGDKYIGKLIDSWAISATTAPIKHGIEFWIETDKNNPPKRNASGDFVIS